MPAKGSKRKSLSDAGNGSSSKKSKREEMDELYQKMKKEADENKIRAREQERREKNDKTLNRRITIAVPPSSNRTNAKPRVGRRSTPAVRESKQRPNKTPPSGLRKHEESDDETSSSLASSGEEDQFDRLVPHSRRRESEPYANRVENEYARTYSISTARSPSRRQQELQRQKELKALRKDRSYSSSDSEDLSVAEDTKEKEVDTAKRQAAEAPVFSIPSSPIVTNSESTTNIIDNILFSIVSFLLGFLLVVGVYTYVTSFEADAILASTFGSNFASLSDYFQTMARRTVQLTIALVMVFCAVEAFLWLNRRANSRKKIVAEMAKEAKAIIREKKLYPSIFIMEEVLEKCSGLKLNEAELDRRLIKSLWPDVEAMLLEDARMQTSEQIFEGKRHRCLCYVLFGSSVNSPSPSLQNVAASPSGKINMF